MSWGKGGRDGHGEATDAREEIPGGTVAVSVLLGLAAGAGASAQQAPPRAHRPASYARGRVGCSRRTSHRSGFDEHREVKGNREHLDVNVCSKLVPAGTAHCDARVRTDAEARSKSSRYMPRHCAPNGMVGNNGAYDPSYLSPPRAWMNLVQSGAGAGQGVAIVDAK